MAEASPQLSNISKRSLVPKYSALTQPQGDDVVALDRDGLSESFRFLKEERAGFDFLSDITAVDYWKKKEPRFEVVYQLVSLQQRAGCASACRYRKATGRGVADTAVARRQLSRTRSVGSLRHSLYRSSGFAAHLVLR